MKQLDLHGYSVDEATATVLNALFSFENDKYSQTLTIICGHGTGAIINTVESILISEGYEYDDEGEFFVVYKKSDFGDDIDDY